MVADVVRVSGSYQRLLKCGACSCRESMHRVAVKMESTTSTQEMQEASVLFLRDIDDSKEPVSHVFQRI